MMWNSVMDFHLPFILICLIITVALSYTLIKAFILFLNYRKEYLSTRGAHHLSIIKSALPNLQNKILQIESKITQKMAELDETEFKQRSDYEQHLAKQIVNQKLISVTGIGKVLRDEIILYCFDGSIDSLLESNRLRGIGPEKYYNIREFVCQAEEDISKMIKTRFNGRAEIDAKYEAKLRILKDTIEKLSSELSPLKNLHKIANDQKFLLESISVMDFAKATRGNLASSEGVTGFINGVFAEWDKMPDWFSALVKDFGE